ncbi:MAG: hypothetical protein BGN84_11345 [Afipia sp. 62-7]|nr:DUF930 domain-containing protein [Afipia sp.]OJU18649.1 MAG: hypothetical protein BGN84_11345 [Afipia sp. 62-7]
MKTSAAVLAVALLAAAPATAESSKVMDPRFAASLKKLDPDTRLEQVCDLEAMNRIARDPNPYRPDRAKTDVISHPSHRGDTVTGKGGAFRSKGRWYSFSFTCKGSPDHMSVQAFSYKIGDPIPESKWAALGLWR